MRDCPPTTPEGVLEAAGMARFDASNAEVLVFSYKDGLLAKMAHDLKIRVESFTIDVDEETRAVEARFDPKSLRVVSARKDGRDDPGTLSSGDIQKIHANIEKDVLEVKRYPEITFRSREVVESERGHRVAGDLTLHGTTRPIVAEIIREGETLRTEIRLHQPDFGVKPYSAALGALKVKADVLVTVTTEPRG
jgi:polyisoprenoid-binding protein YceI